VDDMQFGKRYRVTETIGSGGMADVYKAVDEVLGRTVAIKVLNRHYSADPEFVARFRQEAQAAANLSSPNIVNMYDWGKEGEDTYYIVMEYVAGTDLKELIRRNGPVDPYRAAEYCAQVAAALSVAHGYGIIHRDIKPQNIVLMADGTIKVMDFGIARAVNTLATQTGSVLGTAQYISPEQAQGRDLTPATDLYSLGIVAYELVTGRVPFEGDAPVAIALKQVNDQPVSPRQLNPDVPPAFEAVILKAMSKDPAQRYLSAEQMRADLLRVAEGRAPAAAVPAGVDDTSVMPAVAATAARKPARRGVNPWVWVGVVALLVLAGVGLAAGLGLFESGIAVPDVRGMTLADAKAELDNVGLVAGSVDSTTSQTVAEGLVVASDPNAGTKLESGTPVNLVVSTGKPLVKVPDVVGLPKDEAITALTDLGFTIADPVVEDFNKMKAGLVFAQSPLGETDAPEGSAIQLKVSKGPEQTGVPYVVDLKQGDAIDKLQGAGFKVHSTTKSSEIVAKGYVISQDPLGGEQAPKGSTVTIVVSSGPPQVTVPSVVGLPQADAETMLHDAGFSVQVDPGDPAPDPTKVGTVQSQNPAGNDKAPKGSEVVIKIYQ
jgi:eukaryotic-like serine/threonine-protein kinase